MTQLFASLKRGGIYRNASTNDSNKLFCFHSKSQVRFKIKSSVNEVSHVPLKASVQLIEVKELTYVVQSFAPLLWA